MVSIFKKKKKKTISNGYCSCLVVVGKKKKKKVKTQLFLGEFFPLGNSKLKIHRFQK